MYKIDQENNEIIPLKECNFSDLGIKEREHLQEWVAKTSNIFDEELLIIQKEFAGFSDTNERLDLLALDKEGAIVIIENKLDDSGKDVTWQALKYASYCSGLSKENIRKIYQEYLDKFEPGANAENNLTRFYGVDDYEEIALNKGVTQRIILLARSFRKEVTSTVLWLLNFKMRIQCFKATPHSMGEQLFLTIEQIIPTPDAEEYMIGMAEKAQDELDSENKSKHVHALRKRFWAKLLPAVNAKTTLFQNISPSADGWIGAGSGVGRVAYNFVFTKTYARVEIYIGRQEKLENEQLFDALHQTAEQIDADFGDSLIWERLEENLGCRIRSEIAANIYDESQWDKIIEFMADAMTRLEKAFQEPLAEAGVALKAK